MEGNNRGNEEEDGMKGRDMVGDTAKKDGMGGKSDGLVVGHVVDVVGPGG